MSAWNQNVKSLLLKGLERVSQTASSLAENAHQKLDELNLETRRSELLHEIPVQALELWQNGVELPQELSTLLSELNELDQQLTVMRAQRYAKVEEDETEAPVTDEETEGEEAPAADEETETSDDPEEVPDSDMEENETGGNA